MCVFPGFNHSRVVSAEGKEADAKVSQRVHVALLRDIRADIATNGLGLLWTQREPARHLPLFPGAAARLSGRHLQLPEEPLHHHRGILAGRAAAHADARQQHWREV